jgi:tetratricopeptide (TPR) repeat protein
MTLPTQLAGLSEVRGALTVAPDGRLVSATPGVAGASSDGAAAIAVALKTLADAGATAGLGALQLAHLKGTASSLVGGKRDDALLLVHVEPSRMTSAVEKAVRAWTRGEAATPAPSGPATGARAAAPPPPIPARPAPTAASLPAAPAATPARDAWAVLRHALGRGLLNEAATVRNELASAASPGRAGAEALSREDCDRAVQVLLEGVGSVMAGDGLGGAAILRELAADAQPNLSVRWLALQWSARASVKSGAIPAARAHVQAALTLARQLDVEARALSQWTAAEVLAHDSDSTRALAWLSESRSRFERAADRWGIGQTLLTEARILSGLERYGAASDAAQRAAEHLPGSDEPPVLLARLALLRDEIDAAEALLAAVRTQAAEKVRALIAAIREGVVSKGDAAEYLREHDAAPTQKSLRALARIASAAPRFLQAREALAWMLLRIGRYEDAGGMFRALLSQPLSGADRASVMLGLGCVANAGKAAAPARAVVAAAEAPVPAAGAPLAPVAAPAASQILPRSGTGAGAGTPPDAVFSGQLSSFALPDLLEFLRSGRRTGLLVCSGKGGIGALRFREGRICGGASPGTPGLGDVLVRDGKLGVDALATLAPAGGPEQPDDVLADQIVRGGHAELGTVVAALEAQVWAVVRELVQWTDGEFAFNREEDGARDEGRVCVALDPQAVLLDVFRERDEASRGSAVDTVH